MMATMAQRTRSRQRFWVRKEYIRTALTISQEIVEYQSFCDIYKKHNNNNKKLSQQRCH